MKKKYYIVIGIVYLAVVALAFFLKLEPLLFFLSIPWSIILTFFGFLLIHMFENFQFTYGEVLGALLNLLIFFKLTVFKSSYSNLENDE
jgi:putative Mn2+ efflux pump MntP